MSAARRAVTVVATADVGPAAAFDAIVPIDLAAIFTGFGPVPAVVGVRDQSGPWDAAGRTRTVLLADGTSAGERLVSVHRPASFGYVVGPFGGPLGRLLSHAEGSWTFTPDGDGTRIAWTYTFFARRPRAPALRVLAPVWRRYARRVLAVAERG